MNLYTDFKLLDNALVSLSGKDDGARVRAAIEVKAHVESAARELSLERFAKFENELYLFIINIVNGNSQSERVGGILAIRELIGCTSASAEAKVIRFAKALSTALSNCTDFALITLIADALGHMAKYSPVSHVDYLEGEMNRALEWLKGKNTTQKRFAACTVLQQLAKNAPTIFFARINEFFDLIWGPIWDVKERIRFAAGSALSACLSVLRERTYHLQWYCYLYDQLQEGFHNGQEEFVHGSLLVVAEALKYTGDFMIPRFKEVCRAILTLKDHKSRIVRSAIISLLPSLAMLCPDAFARSHLDETVEFLQKSSRSSELRPQVLVSTGKLCLAIGQHLVGRMDDLLVVVRESFSGKKSGSKHVHEAVSVELLGCISDMVQGLGGSCHDHVLSLLDPMLQGGLTQELIDTLSVISTQIPTKRNMIQMRLLDEATKVLGGTSRPVFPDPEYMFSWSHKGVRLPKNFAQNAGGNMGGSTPGTPMTADRMASSASLATLGTGRSMTASNLQQIEAAKLKNKSSVKLQMPPAPSSTPSTPAASTSKPRKGFHFLGGFRGSKSSKEVVGVNVMGSGMALGTEEDNIPAKNQQSHEIVLLSLRTLSSLTIPIISLVPLIQNSVLPYLNSDDFRVRREAAISCSKMITTCMTPLHTRGPTAEAIEEILLKILEVVVSDISPQVRIAVLQSLSADFDKYLAREHHVQTLFLLLSDEFFDIKIEAMCVLGRLAKTNPAVILPSVRLQLIRIISELKSCPDHKAIEEATLMLCTFLRFPAFHAMVRPFMQTLIDTVPLHSDLRARTAALEAIGELSIVLQQDILPYVNTLLTIIIENMLDQSSYKKQEVAVKTLGQLVSSTGLAIRPYLQYPQLLPKALDMLVENDANRPYSLRIEILRTLGLIGALDPARYATITEFLRKQEKKQRELEEARTIERKEKAAEPIAIPIADEKERDSMTTPNTPREREERLKVVATTPETSHTMPLGALIKTDQLLDVDKETAPAHLYMYEQLVMGSLAEPPHIGEVRITPQSDEFYPKVAVAALIKVLRDPSLSLHHSSATQTIIQIFRCLGSRCVPFLEQIVPYFLQIVRHAGSGLRESVLQQLSQLISITGQNITPYLPAIVEILQLYWSEHLEYVLAIVQQVATSSSDSFTVYLPVLAPLLLSCVAVPRNVTANSLRADRNLLRPLEQTLNCLKLLRVALRPHLHLFVPALCKLITQMQDLSWHDTIATQVQAVHTLRRLCAGSKGAVVEQSHVLVSVIVHTVTRTFIRAHQHNLPPSANVYNECIATLCTIAQQIGKRILPFDSLIMRSIEGRGLETSSYRDLSRAIHSNMWNEANQERDDTVSGGGWADGTSDVVFMGARESELIGIGVANRGSGDRDKSDSGANDLAAIGQKLILNQQALQRAWDVSQRSTANDWHEWLWRFNIDLLRENPIPTMRACAPLAQAHAPMAKELFHAAFVSCWHELTDQFQDHLIRSLQTAFRSNTMPADILQSLLNLCEFMEHDVEALPISLPILAELAQKGHAYAKALHYRELEFQSNPASCFESLISINKQLDQYEAASGLLKVVKQIEKKYPELKSVYTVQEGWLAQLGHWDEAMIKYDEKLAANKQDSAAIAGKMKCLNALGKWEDVIAMCEDNLNYLRVDSENSSSPVHAKAAVIGARAAWSLGEWSLMNQYVQQVSEEEIDGSFLRVILAVHQDNYPEAAKFIEMTRRKLDRSITSLLAESYGRAYQSIIMVQQCSELEEIVEYKKLLRQIGCIPEAGDKELSTAAAGKAFSGVPMTAGKHENISRHLFLDQSDAYAQESATASRQALQAEAMKRKAFLLNKWRVRLNGCTSTGRTAIPYWKYMLNCRRLVINEKDDLDTWLEFVSLCRNAGNHSLSERVLSMAQQTALGNNVASAAESLGNLSLSSGFGMGMAAAEDNVITERRIRYAVLKQQWAVGERQKALNGLEQLVRSAAGNTTPVGDTSFLSCLLKLGEWKVGILDPTVPVNPNTRHDVLALYSKATLVDPHSYNAWHQWGLSNYRAIEEARQLNPATSATTPHSRVYSPATAIQMPNIAGGRMNPYKSAANKLVPGSVQLPADAVISYAVNAIKGLMRALTLGTRQFSSSVTQDMLCILSLWFRYGKIPEVCASLEQGLASVAIENWLGVLPQLIARIDHHDEKARGLLHNLLIRLGVKHAQALVYPLSVALMSPKGERKEAAEVLMNSLREHSSKIVEQTLLVSRELVRVAILWEESWHWSLEEASMQYFGDGNIQGMLDILVPLHRMLEAGPTTLREVNFCQAYGNELGEAWENIKNYLRVLEETGASVPTSGANKKSSSTPTKPEDQYLHQAWDLYFSVFKRINVQLPTITSLELNSCSPALNAARDMDIGVPGTYAVTGPGIGTAVRIRNFSQTVAIIRSKQRPRKIRIVGEDGAEFIFLLKGHEDLRQDERAMQLFGLVNALLYHDRRTGVEGIHQDFSIQRYAVMPLSPTAGLISWVPNCDTLHDLIRSYRESRKIMLDVEHKLILQVAPNKLYDSLPAMHKLEVFEYALAYTAGEDLAKILWLKSDNSEVWLQRRATYTRSLAVMSMVGYILGLGDRHPSNLMLDRGTGKILHIDFGDCFEVAMHREKFPEKVPFRLTRMLVNAMEVAGIEGNYRSTCEKVMSVLRENRDSLVATLEAFVHDPLISWRLLNINKNKGKQEPEAPSSSGTASPVPTPHPVPAATARVVSPVNMSKAAEGAAAAEEELKGAKRRTSIPLMSASANVLSTLEPIAEGPGDGEDKPLTAVPPNITTFLPPPPPGEEPAKLTLLSPKSLLVLEEKAKALQTVAEEEEDSNHDSEELAGIAINGGGKTNGNNGSNQPKTVSFSVVNQTIDKDNTVRTSSSAVMINHPHSNLTTNIFAVNSPTSAASSSDTSPVVTKPNNPPTLSSSFFRANLHLEMGAMANSVNMHSPTRSATFSVKGSSLRHLMGGGGGGGGGENVGRIHSITLSGDNADSDVQVELTEKAVIVIRRVMDKLTGLDFHDAASSSTPAVSPKSRMFLQIPAGPHHHISQALEVPEQVDRLIREATSNENLSQSFFGWCPFW